MDQMVKVDLISDAAKVLEAGCVVGPHRDNYQVQTGAIWNSMAVAGDQSGQAV